MTLIDTVANVLKDEVGIVALYQKAITTKADKYAMYNVYNQDKNGNADDKPTRIVSYITISYWCTNVSDIALHVIIEDKMEANGFIFDGGRGTPDTNGIKYGYTMDFIHIKQLYTD